MIELYDWQKEALQHMKNGCILCGGVGSGKSRTALAYYHISNGGSIKPFNYIDYKTAKDLYIITTAKKRDSKEWESEFGIFAFGERIKITIDSWNNIYKYKKITNAFFIFDEQRVVGYGAWTKSFLSITKNNDWILLSATPGDCWMDYMPVFIANGFYKHKTDFIDQHVIYSHHHSYPKVDRYVNTGRLLRLRNNILVKMDYIKKTENINNNVIVDYNHQLYKSIIKDRWNYEKNKPIETASELCYELRRLVNSDDSRIAAVLEIYESLNKVIIFYNYDYELEILKNIQYVSVTGKKPIIAEWNGHKHQPIPKSKDWVYLVQYNAGAEAWNCIQTNTIIFYSQTYSYKILTQAAGRIDRANTPFNQLYYYHLKSRSGIDNAITLALSSKKKFNESAFYKKITS